MKIEPEISYMHLFVNICYVYLIYRTLRNYTIEVKRGYFMGYNKYSPAYSVYFPEKEVVKIVRTVKVIDKFNEEYSNLSVYYIFENNIMSK